MRRRLIEWVIRTALLVVAVASCFGATEGYGRSSKRWWDDRLSRNRPPDDAPNAVGQFVELEFDVRVVNNSHGFHDFDRSLPKQHRWRLQFIGDSFVEAMQVPREQSFYNRLNERFRATALDAEAMGLGRAGWSTSGYFYLYEKYGAAFQPDVVVATIFISNDLEADYPPFGLRRRVAPRHRVTADGHAAETTQADRDQWQALMPPRPALAPAHPFYGERLPGLQFLVGRYAAGNHRLYQAARRIGIIDEVEERQRLPRYADVWLSPPPPYVVGAIDHAITVLRAFREQVEARGARFLVLLLPGMEQGIPNWFADRLSNYPASEHNQYDLDLVNRTLTARLTARGIPCFDLLAPFRQRYAEGGEVYFPADGHLSPAGHQFLADVLHNYFQRDAAHWFQ